MHRETTEWHDYRILNNPSWHLGFLWNSWDLCCWLCSGNLTFLLSWFLSLPFSMMVSINFHLWMFKNFLHLFYSIFLYTFISFSFSFLFFSLFFISLTCELLLGTIMTISKDRVKPSPLPDSWKLSEIFATGVVIGTYLAFTTVIFFWGVHETSFFAVNFSSLHFIAVRSSSWLDGFYVPLYCP